MVAATKPKNIAKIEMKLSSKAKPEPAPRSFGKN